jgi:hypothetical protein
VIAFACRAPEYPNAAQDLMRERNSAVFGGLFEVAWSLGVVSGVEQDLTRAPFNTAHPIFKRASGSVMQRFADVRSAHVSAEAKGKLFFDSVVECADSNHRDLQRFLSYI